MDNAIAVVLRVLMRTNIACITVLLMNLLKVTYGERIICRLSHRILMVHFGFWKILLRSRRRILVIKRHNLWHLWILEGPGRLHDILSTNYLYILDLSATWQCCRRSISLAKFVQTLPDNCLHRQHLHILEHGDPMLRLVASHLVLRLSNQLRTWLGSVAAGSQYCAFVTSSLRRFH